MLKHCYPKFSPNVKTFCLTCPWTIVASAYSSNLLGQLRASVSAACQVSQIHLPSISVASLDRVVCSLRRTRNQLQGWGYNIQRQAFSSALNEPPFDLSASNRNLGGRPSKVSNNDCIQLVKDKLTPYLKESERILVIGRGAQREMVLAQHLTKKRRAIYTSERELCQKMSYQVFLKILKIHCSHVKNPRRKTDIGLSVLVWQLLVSRYVWGKRVLGYVQYVCFGSFGGFACWSASSNFIEVDLGRDNKISR